MADPEYFVQCECVCVCVFGCLQWETHVTSSALAETLRVPEDIGLTMQERRLRWLGHVARMEDHRLPKCVLFGELPAPRPSRESAPPWFYSQGKKIIWHSILRSHFACFYVELASAGR